MQRLLIFTAQHELSICTCRLGKRSAVIPRPNLARGVRLIEYVKYGSFTICQDLPSLNGRPSPSEISISPIHTYCFGAPRLTPPLNRTNKPTHRQHPHFVNTLSHPKLFMHQWRTLSPDRRPNNPIPLVKFRLAANVPSDCVEFPRLLLLLKCTPGTASHAPVKEP